MQVANPINLTCIDHVVVRTSNLHKMMAFYCDVLGCKLERGPGELRLAQLRVGHSLIDLVDVKGPLGLAGGEAPDHNAPNMDHVCLQVDPWDEASIVGYLGSHGVEMDEVSVRYGARGMGPSIYMRDPDGNTVELKGSPS